MGLLPQVDNALKNANSDYEAKRHEKMCITYACYKAWKGTFQEWLRNAN